MVNEQATPIASHRVWSHLPPTQTHGDLERHALRAHQLLPHIRVGQHVDRYADHGQRLLRAARPERLDRRRARHAAGERGAAHACAEEEEGLEAGHGARARAERRQNGRRWGRSKLKKQCRVRGDGEDS